MGQLTLRGMDKDVERRVRQLAARQHTSMNKAALGLLRHGAGLGVTQPQEAVIGNALDDFIGSWSTARAREFDAAVAVFEKIDHEQWR